MSARPPRNGDTRTGPNGRREIYVVDDLDMYSPQWVADDRWQRARIAVVDGIGLLLVIASIAAVVAAAAIVAEGT